MFNKIATAENLRLAVADTPVKECVLAFVPE